MGTLQTQLFRQITSRHAANLQVGEGLAEAAEESGRNDAGPHTARTAMGGMVRQQVLPFLFRLLRLAVCLGRTPLQGPHPNLRHCCAPRRLAMMCSPK